MLLTEQNRRRPDKIGPAAALGSSVINSSRGCVVPKIYWRSFDVAGQSNECSSVCGSCGRKGDRSGWMWDPLDWRRLSEACSNHCKVVRGGQRPFLHLIFLALISTCIICKFAWHGSGTDGSGSQIFMQMQLRAASSAVGSGSVSAAVCSFLWLCLLFFSIDVWVSCNRLVCDPRFVTNSRGTSAPVFQCGAERFEVGADHSMGLGLLVAQ